MQASSIGNGQSGHGEHLPAYCKVQYFVKFLLPSKKSRSAVTKNEEEKKERREGKRAQTDSPRPIQKKNPLKN